MLRQIAEEDEEGSGWETASDVDAADETMDPAAVAEEAEEWEDWDLCRSLFDNHISPNMDVNLEYMYRNFGFYFPDATYLTDPESLLKYLVSLIVCLCFGAGNAMILNSHDFACMA